VQTWTKSHLGLLVYFGNIVAETQNCLASAGTNTKLVITVQPTKHQAVYSAVLIHDARSEHSWEAVVTATICCHIGSASECTDTAVFCLSTQMVAAPHRVLTGLLATVVMCNIVADYGIG
jgi:hypothetical protein